MTLLHQNVYLLTDLQKVTIIQIHSDDKYHSTSNGKTSINANSQDKDLVIQLLKQDYQALETLGGDLNNNSIL